MKTYPFAAIVGQDNVRKAYLANIVNPRIGGLLISGPKGTGKSTIVHSVKTVLPEYEAVEGCPFRCDPDASPEKMCVFCQNNTDKNRVSFHQRVVKLPLSCTEDRLIGSVDVETLLKTGKKEIQVGILGEAHRNILYIDEVNLLPDHLVDDILDTVASHWNIIEREGVSISHPSDFFLVGTMNPEEGELRPQILDRFPLCVNIRSVQDPRLRVEIIKRNHLFDNDPEAFHELFHPEERILKQLIIEARQILPRVRIEDPFLMAIAGACVELKIDGQRPDIVIMKTAQTLAAMEKRQQVTPNDVIEAARFTLIHRTRDCGLLEPPQEEEIQSVFKKHLSAVHSKKVEKDLEKSVSSKDISIDKSLDTFIPTDLEQNQESTETVVTDEFPESASGEKKTFSP